MGKDEKEGKEFIPKSPLSRSGIISKGNIEEVIDLSDGEIKRENMKIMVGDIKNKVEYWS